jgi:hypothetical protein
VIQLSVKEAIVPSGTSDRDHDLNKLKSVLDRCGVVLIERKPSASTTTFRGGRGLTRGAIGEFMAKDVLSGLLVPSSILSGSSADPSTLIRASNSALSTGSRMKAHLVFV